MRFEAAVIGFSRLMRSLRVTVDFQSLCLRKSVQTIQPLMILMHQKSRSTTPTAVCGMLTKPPTLKIQTVRQIQKSTLNTSFSVGGSDHTGLRKDIFIPEPVSHRCTKQNLLHCCILSIIKSILHPFKHTLINRSLLSFFFFSSLLSLPSLCQQSLSLLRLTVWLLQTSVLMHVPTLPPHAHPAPPGSIRKY